MPDLYASLDEIRNHLQAGDYGNVIKEIWSGIHPQTIDYGIMENAEDVVVLPARGLGWNDVGAGILCLTFWRPMKRQRHY